VAYSKEERVSGETFFLKMKKIGFSTLRANKKFLYLHRNSNPTKGKRELK